MRLHRPLLYAGVFLVAIGGIGFAADAGTVPTDVLTGIVRLWPLTIMAIGLALVLRRTRLSLAGGLAAAAMPGLLIGSAFAVLPRISDACSGAAGPTSLATQEGTFPVSAGAQVSIETGCAALNVTAVAGQGWRVDANGAAGFPPTVVASSETLAITPARGGWRLLASTAARGDAWNVSIPQELGLLHVDVNAGRGNIVLPGATLEGVFVTSNVGDVLLDLSTARVGEVSASVNMGHLAVLLPGEDLQGRVRVNAGNLELCVPPDAALQVSTRGKPATITYEGVRQSGGDFVIGDVDAPYRIDLDATVNFGSIDINPIGGCR